MFFSIEHIDILIACSAKGKGIWFPRGPRIVVKLVVVVFCALVTLLVPRVLPVTIALFFVVALLFHRKLLSRFLYAIW